MNKPPKYTDHTDYSAEVLCISKKMMTLQTWVSETTEDPVRDKKRFVTHDENFDTACQIRIINEAHKWLQHSISRSD